MRRLLLALLASAALTGCTAVQPGDKPIPFARGPVPVTSQTPMSNALVCLGKAMPKALDLRLAVQNIPDRTGVADYDGPGAYATQGAELMMVTALGKAKARQVNRVATNVAEWELAQALEQRLGEGHNVQVGNQAYPFRPVQMGAFLGSTHTIYGAITELDFDIASGGAEVEIAGIGAKARGYYVSLGLDVMVADTRTTEIVLARSYRKQVWGREVEGSLYRFWDLGSGGDNIGEFGRELFDVRVGEQKNEPIQASIRWVIELAAYELLRDLNGIGKACEKYVADYSRSEPATVALGQPPRIQAAPAAYAPPAQPERRTTLAPAAPAASTAPAAPAAEPKLAATAKPAEATKTAPISSGRITPPLIGPEPPTPLTRPSKATVLRNDAP